MLDLLSSIFLERPMYNWRVVHGSSRLGAAEILPRKMTEQRAAKFSKSHGVELAKVILPKQTFWRELVEIGMGFLVIYFVVIPALIDVYLLVNWLRHG